MSRSEAARVGSMARWATRTTPEQRRAEMRKPRIASAVQTIVENWPTLDPAQVAKLRALLQQPGGGSDA
jgi:hypothetical protein